MYVKFLLNEGRYFEKARTVALADRRTLHTGGSVGSKLMSSETKKMWKWWVLGVIEILTLQIKPGDASSLAKESSRISCRMRYVAHAKAGG